jgi:predicted glycogen debranching enzyme
MDAVAHGDLSPWIRKVVKYTQNAPAGKNPPALDRQGRNRGVDRPPTARSDPLKIRRIAVSKAILTFMPIPPTFPQPLTHLDFPDVPPDAAPPDESLSREWLLTNGLGSYAMGTPAGVNTRRYHGLLIAAARPPVQRFSTLCGIVDSLAMDGKTYDLATHEFRSPGGTVFHPHGFDYLERFEKDLAVRWIYSAGHIRVVKELRLVWKRQLAVLSYTMEPLDRTAEAIGPVALSITPLIALRDFHHLRRQWSSAAPQVKREGEAALQLSTDGWPAIHLECSEGKFTEHHDWWTNFARRVESQRQQDDTEDLFAPGRFDHEFMLLRDKPVTVNLYFGAEPIDREACDAPSERSVHLVKQLVHVESQLGPHFTPDHTSPWPCLIAAADDFIVERQVEATPMATVLAGYPWFADWGRDTMISMSGLMLATARFDDAKSTLLAYARHVRRGLVPNHFDDYGGEPHYNTVDASLWFIHAALEYRRLSGDEATWCDLLADACCRIIEAYQIGTDGPVKMDSDGLISAGSSSTQLTWMDAARDGVVFTPRFGKAVEINALWHRALMGCSEAMTDCEASRATAASYAKLAAKVKRSFNQTFWSDELGYCIDHVAPHGPDRSLRPNQVLAVSLPHSPLPPAKQKRVVQIVREKLLTSMGLRTLPGDDPNFHPYYSGSMFQRDGAYHQGTVWAWLMGPYIEAHLRANQFSEAARQHARQTLAPLHAQLMGPGLGQVHEIFDASAPFRPDGCPAQAWSVAELLRVSLLTEVGTEQGTPPKGGR